ncbi:MAG: beta-mannosidase, partial [Thermomicrobium sp.]
LPEGATLRVRVAGNEHGRAFLPVEPTEATVIARDQLGRPALLARQVGLGQLLLMTYPLEYFAAARPHANPDEGTIVLYSALAREACAAPPVSIRALDIWCDRLVRDDGTVFLWIISERDTTAVVNLEVPEGTELLHLTTGEPITQPPELPPYGVAVLRLAR